MTLEDTLRNAQRWPMPGPAPDTYSTPYPDLDVDWRWSEVWRLNNPSPPRDNDPDNSAWNEWYAQFKIEMDRAWVQAIFPQFRVLDWKIEDVQTMRKLIAGHVCGVCGRSDDSGCWKGC